MTNQELETVSRAKIWNSPEFSPLKENLMYAASQRSGDWNPMLPIRALPFSVFFKRNEKKALAETIMNPDLPQIMFSEFGVRVGEYAKGRPGGLAEAVSIPKTLVALKVADTVIEGAEPYSQWKEYVRVIDMPTPLFNVPIDKYTDWTGHDDFESYRATEGGPLDMGGQSIAVALNCEDNNGYYRAKVGVRRNDIRDNKFLSVEQNLKNAGAAWYFGLGKKIIDFYVANATNTDTRVMLELAIPIHSELEALVNVIRARFPSNQLNRADTAFINQSLLQ